MLTYPVFINGNQWHNQQCWILKSIHPKQLNLNKHCPMDALITNTHKKRHKDALDNMETTQTPNQLTTQSL